MFDRLFDRLFDWMLNRMLGWLFFGMFGRLQVTPKRLLSSLQQTAWSCDRAVLLWAAITVCSSALALSESTVVGAILAATVLPAVPIKIATLHRVVLVLLSVAQFLLGPEVLLASVPLAFTTAGYNQTALVSLFGLTAAAGISQHFQSVPTISGLPIHLGSLIALSTPTLVAGVVLSRWLQIRGLLALITALLLLICSLVLGADVWFDEQTLANSLFRLTFAVVPLMASIAAAPRGYVDGQVKPAALLAFPVGLAIALLVPASPISSIIFDESHGKWETVKASFGKDDFGRDANYTYSLLNAYSERLVGRTGTIDDEAATIPDLSDLLVIKMPSVELGGDFIDRTVSWVHTGGRLVVIADHTDLYDNAQNVNVLLSRFGYSLAADAVFDPHGMPNIPRTQFAAAILGRIDARDTAFPWQTGTSFSRLPVNALRLATFGLSYSEPGDYSRQNRFGYFQPRINLRFGAHAAVAISSYGQGAVAVVLDSTPWSNFAFFRSEYQALFRGLVGTATVPSSIMIAGWAFIALAAVTLFCVGFPKSLPIACGALVLGLLLGSTGKIAAAALMPAVEGRDYALRVIAGEAARFEFLKQLVPAGVHNYSRIVSAMAKYGLQPSATAPGTERPQLERATKWLLIEPDGNQLPGADDVLYHLKRGGNLTVLFAPGDATRPDVNRWLSSLSLVPARAVGLAISEDVRPGGLMARRGAELSRIVRTSVSARPTSFLKEHQADGLFQAFTVRPTTFPRTSGILSLSFSGDQFSDDAIGEVWEGIRPSALGRHREAQLAAVLGGEDFLPPMPAGVVVVSSGDGERLPAYVVFENGKKILDGMLTSPLPRGAGQVPSVSEEAASYFADLRQQAVGFVSTRCPTPGEVCADRLIGRDLVEWTVKWSAARDGRLLAIELLHERRFSGTGSTWNVLFGE